MLKIEDVAVAIVNNVKSDYDYFGWEQSAFCPLVMFPIHDDDSCLLPCLPKCDVSSTAVLVARAKIGCITFNIFPSIFRFLGAFCFKKPNASSSLSSYSLYTQINIL